MKIRLEDENDYFEVENLVRNSFWNIYRPGAFEHYIVHNLRNDESFIKDLAYIIENDGKIIGHINYSYGKINYENGNSQKAIVLGPVSIDNDFQNEGYGSRLIKYTLEMIEKRDEPCVFVIGDESYYSRFGFETASKYNLFLDGTDTREENPFFMIKIFKNDEIVPQRGIFKNPQVFEVDENDVDEFDGKFFFKEKKILDTQLNI